jgi:hypothetical protein
MGDWSFFTLTQAHPHPQDSLSRSTCLRTISFIRISNKKLTNLFTVGNEKILLRRCPWTTASIIVMAWTFRYLYNNRETFPRIPRSDDAVRIRPYTVKSGLVYGAVLLCPRLRGNTVRLQRLWSKFTVEIRITVSIDLGSMLVYIFEKERVKQTVQVSIFNIKEIIMCVTRCP